VVSTGRRNTYLEQKR